MTSLTTYWHTLRHLKPAQFMYRLRYRLGRPAVSRAGPPALRPHAADWVESVRRPCAMLAADRFRFLNQVERLAPGEWDSPRWAKLWRYNLHYFDDLNAVDAAARREWHRGLIEQWVEENPMPTGSGWEPYPVSLRIVNWIRWALSGNALSDAAMHSLCLQARWLERRLEYHILANHLFANAKALVFAGLFFCGEEAERWLRRGLAILGREVPEQVLADGGHFEHSPMYHALVLEDMLDMLNLGLVYSGAAGSAVLPDAQWRQVASRMLGWHRRMTHPDGEIAFFNDAACAIAPTHEQLAAYAGRLDIALPPEAHGALTRLEQSGYIRAEAGPAVLIVNIAEIGPDYQPGHAHADTLSFECSLHGRRLLVNSGIDRYGADAERLRQRGTLAHNTVTVNGTDSSEVWDGFRVARRARPRLEALRREEDVIEISASHDGYRRLGGNIVHWRNWSLHPGGLRIEDQVKGDFDTAEARFYLHPDVTVEAGPKRQGGFRLRMAGGEEAVVEIEGGNAACMASTWHPEFGLAVPNRCIAVAFTASRVTLSMTW